MQSIERGTTRAAACDTDLAGGRWSWTLLWGIPIGVLVATSFIGVAQGPVWAAAFFWMGGACVANARRCGRFHCYITGPVFLTAALVSLGNAVGVLAVEWGALGIGVIVLVVLAHVPEVLGKRYVGRKPA